MSRTKSIRTKSIILENEEIIKEIHLDVRHGSGVE